MKGMKQILLAGFAALCMVLPACHTAIPGEEFARRTPLVISSEPLNTVSYTAEYTQDGALPFTCEVKLGTDGRIRRDYVWKDEKGAEKKASVVINGTEAIKSEDGKSVPAKDTDKAMAELYSRLILNPASVICSAFDIGRGEDTKSSRPVYFWTLELADVPGAKSTPLLPPIPSGKYIVAIDEESWLWSTLVVYMENDSDYVSTVFSDYKTESGVTYPSRIVSSTEGGAPVTCVIRDVKINPELPDELFRLPETNG
jgi:outer membrane lipoprotein-sorting protein